MICIYSLDKCNKKPAHRMPLNASDVCCRAAADSPPRLSHSFSQTLPALLSALSSVLRGRRKERERGYKLTSKQFQCPSHRFFNYVACASLYRARRGHRSRGHCTADVVPLRALGALRFVRNGSCGTVIMINSSRSSASNPDILPQRLCVSGGHFTIC